MGPQFQAEVSRFSLNSGTFNVDVGCRKWLQDKRNNLLLRL